MSTCTACLMIAPVASLSGRNEYILSRQLCPSLWLADSSKHFRELDSHPRSLTSGEGICWTLAPVRGRLGPQKEIYNLPNYLVGETGAETMMGQCPSGPHLSWDCLAMQTAGPLLKPKPHAGTPKTNTDITVCLSPPSQHSHIIEIFFCKTTVLTSKGTRIYSRAKHEWLWLESTGSGYPKFHIPTWQQFHEAVSQRT